MSFFPISKQINLDLKDSVETYEDIMTTYPSPEDGWMVNVKDSDITYRYTGFEWIPISSNSILKATSSYDGLMSKEDKDKLDNLPVSPTLDEYNEKIQELNQAINEKQDNLGFIPENVTNKGNPYGYAPLNEKSEVPFVNLPQDIVTNDKLNDKLSGLGDMKKSVYDTTDNGKVDVAELAESVEWDNVENKPSSFPPSSHNHDGFYAPLVGGVVPISNLPSELVTQDELSGAGLGDMLKNVYDKNNNGKIDTAELAESVPWTGVTGKPSTYPPEAHNHDGAYAPLVDGIVPEAYLPPMESGGTGDMTKAVYDTTDNGKVDVAEVAESVDWSGVQNKPTTLNGYGIQLGTNVVNTGTNSLATGNATKATGNNSFAEGDTTVSSGDTSHAEGYKTSADSPYSHAQGKGAVSSAIASHAEGINSIATYGTHVIKLTAVNNTDKTVTVENATGLVVGDTIHLRSQNASMSSITAKVTAINGLIVTLDTTEVLSFVSYKYLIRKNPSNTSATSHAEGNATIASGQASHAEGMQTIASGNYTHAEGYLTTASGSTAHAEGSGTLASGTISHAEGYQTTASGDHSHAEGYQTLSTYGTIYTIVAFDDTTKTLTLDKTGVFQGDTVNIVAFGQAPFPVYVSASDVINKTITLDTTKIIDFSWTKVMKQSSGSAANHAEGYQTIASGQYAHAEGYNTLASGNSSHAEGFGTTSSGESSHTEGGSTLASGQYSHAEGYLTTASGEASHSEGNQTLAIGNYSHAEGDKTLAGQASHAEGMQTTAYTGTTGKILSMNPSAKQVTLDYLGDMSTSIPVLIVTPGFAPVETIPTSIDTTNKIVTLGNLDLASLMTTPTYIIAKTNSDSYSHAEGKGTYAISTSSHAEGYATTALGESSHAEGYNTTALGAYSHAEGQNTIASGNASHAEGSGTTASGAYSHAEGSGTIASGRMSHAEGINTIAVFGTVYNIIGYNSSSRTLTLNNVTGLSASSVLTISVDSPSTPPIEVKVVSVNTSTNTVELNSVDTKGQPVTVSSSNKYAIAPSPFGNPTHAEGHKTIATGESSHAEGFGTIAFGSYSHAEGVNTTTTHIGAHIMGKYGDSPADYSWSLANGTSSSAKGLATKIQSDGKVFSDGAYASTGADYAEMFEWADENPEDEDRVGYFVTFDENNPEKIRFAKSTDTYILGIISATPAIVGDNIDMNWKDRWLKDEWGRNLTHEVTIPAVIETIRELSVDPETLEEVWIEVEYEVMPERKEIQQIPNPDWNPEDEYIPREQRKEWDAVGIVGKLRVRDDGTCEAGKLCYPNDQGIATLSNDKGYMVMKRISSNQVLVMFK